ncbi:MAG: ATP-binding protein [Planctomycetota bacterium]
MAFEEIAGQDRAVDLLRAELRSGGVPHAHLFVGPGGVGRRAVARELAGVMLCGESSTDMCGNCENCRAFAHDNHPDYLEIGVPEGRQSLPISLIRGDEGGKERGVQEEAALKPVTSDRRVFVVRDTEMMTMEAANCFLKTLEEPPGESYFILLASGLQEIPDTIISRCRLIKFSGLPPDRVAGKLEEKGVDGADAAWLARRTWGSPGKASDFMEKQLHRSNQEIIGELLQMGPRDNIRLSDELRERADELGDSSAERRQMLQELVECIAVFFRDVAVVKLDPGVELFNEDMRERITAYADKRDIDTVVELADRSFEALERVGANANQRLVTLDLFSHLCA